MKIAQKTKDKLWWLLISVEYDYSRVVIADHLLNSDSLTLWLEDKLDFKNTLDECLQVDVPIRQFAKVIKDENLNSYEGTKVHATNKFVYKARIEINEPIKWYQEDAAIIEQQWAREAVLKKLLTQLVETEVEL